MILIVGLGNPGKKFEKSRHNLGFIVLDKFSRENHFPGWEKSKKVHCFFTKKLMFGKEIEMVKPLTFMNSSGKVVKSIAKKHNLKGENVIVVHDDLDLLLGKIKIVKNRGSAGHKGVQSIIDELGTKNFVRFRVGIQPTTYNLQLTTLDKFVLQKFNKEEEKILKKVIERTVEAIEIAIKEGIEKVMNKFNK